MTSLKKTACSALALSLISTCAIPYEDIDLEDVSNAAVPKRVKKSSSTNFYAGLGYALMTMHQNTGKADSTSHTVTLHAGYNLHKYLAVESRYTTALSDMYADNGTVGVNKNWNISNIALYLKPQYPNDGFTLYGLLGYGQVTFDNGVSYPKNCFQWGAGTGISATDDINVFIDYTRLYDDGLNAYSDNNDITVDLVNVSVNYNF